MTNALSKKVNMVEYLVWYKNRYIKSAKKYRLFLYANKYTRNALNSFLTSRNEIM
jgi:hypothetical protein